MAPNQVTGQALFKELGAVSPKVARELIGQLERINFDAIDDLISSYGLSAARTAAWKTTVMERHRLLLLVLKEEADLGLCPAEQLVEKSRLNRSLRKAEFKREEISALRRAVTDRFMKEFLENTTFKSFDEYKTFIDSVPVYRAFVDSFFSKVKGKIVQWSMTIGRARSGPMTYTKECEKGLMHATLACRSNDIDK